MPKSAQQRRRQLHALLGDLPQAEIVAFLKEWL